MGDRVITQAVDRKLSDALGIVVVLGGTFCAAAASTLTTAYAAPAYTTSRYETSVNTTTLYNQGCSAASGPGGIHVLDFGKPWWDGSQYGTILLSSNNFASLTDIQNAAEYWLAGWWSCSPANAYTRLAIGTSNCGSGSNCLQGPGYVGSGHGAAFARVVNNVNNWICCIGTNYSSKETARGADDIEMSWNSASVSRAWADGYASAYVGSSYYYDYGSADGCPPYGSCNSGWTQEDVWYVSWGVSPGWPLPEIYCLACYPGDTNGGNAAEWYQMSLYAYTHHANRMTILGSFTQWQAAGNCCTNSPSDGWNQLNNALNNDSRTAQTLSYSTDITWSQT